jgi:hypothetical protein
MGLIAHTLTRFPQLAWGGCDVTRDTGRLIASVSGEQSGAMFASADVSTFTLAHCGWRGFDWLQAPQVAGVARKAAAPAAPSTPPLTQAEPTPARAPGTVTRGVGS